MTQTDQQVGTSTPEPWAYSCTGGICGADGAHLGSLTRQPIVTNASRIVACVNALAGIPDPADLRRRHDEAVEACRAVREKATQYQNATVLSNAELQKVMNHLLRVVLPVLDGSPDSDLRRAEERAADYGRQLLEACQGLVDDWADQFGHHEPGGPGCDAVPGDHNTPPGPPCSYCLARAAIAAASDGATT